MATRTRSKSSSPPASTAPAPEPATDQPDQLPGAPTSEDLGLDKGYIGQSADPHPNEAYSQETDPLVSPGAAEAARNTGPQEDAA